MGKSITNIEPPTTSFVDYYKSNPNNISYWYPRIKNCGIPTPETLIFEVPDEVARAYFMDKPNECMNTILKFVEDVLIPGIPNTMWDLFIKNGSFSNKYDFSTCHCRRHKFEIARNIIEQNYMAEMVGAGGLSEIAVREFIGSYRYVHENIPCIYNGMPLRPEFRVFYDFDSKSVLYSVNYWDYDYCHEEICKNKTDQIIFDNCRKQLESFFETHKNKVEQLINESSINSADLTGQWSIDIMYDAENDKYWLIDMAVAQASAYWNPTCLQKE